MFNEQEYANVIKNGTIEVICGPMFSGKTEELLRRLKRARIANLPIAIFKPLTDNRYSELNIVSHDANFYPSLVVSHPSEMIKHSANASVVAFDEAQFFDAELPDVVEKLAMEGKRVIAAGLDMDSYGKPFGSMPQLMSIADYVTKLSAICVVCGAPATHTYRKAGTPDTVTVGGSDFYEPRCRKCFYNRGQESGDRGQ
jgi:thymidine kinase